MPPFARLPAAATKQAEIEKVGRPSTPADRTNFTINLRPAEITAHLSSAGAAAAAAATRRPRRRLSGTLAAAAQPAARRTGRCSRSPGPGTPAAGSPGVPGSPPGSLPGSPHRTPARRRKGKGCRACRICEQPITRKRGRTEVGVQRKIRQTGREGDEREEGKVRKRRRKGTHRGGGLRGEVGGVGLGWSLNMVRFICSAFRDCVGRSVGLRQFHHHSTGYTAVSQSHKKKGKPSTTRLTSKRCHKKNRQQH